MIGTVTRRRPTNGNAPGEKPAPMVRLSACTRFVAGTDVRAMEDRAIAAQDPDIAIESPADRLSAMPSSPSWPLRVRRWLVRLFRTLAGPSSLSPATGRSIVRLPARGRALGFREFTLPRRAPKAAPLRVRLKSAALGAARVAQQRKTAP